LKLGEPPGRSGWSMVPGTQKKDRLVSRFVHVEITMTQKRGCHKSLRF
jgi:hypothetical protein